MCIKVIDYCKCGHEAEKHDIGWLDEEGNILLNACYGDWTYSIKKCSCNDFKRDNLKYLEDLCV